MNADVPNAPTPSGKPVRAAIKKVDIATFGGGAKAAAASPTVFRPGGAPAVNRVPTGIRVRANDLPDICVIYGPEGVGKTRFALDAPAPVLLAAEDGSRGRPVPRLEVHDADAPGGLRPPRTLDEVSSCLMDLAEVPDGHGFETLVIDSLDWLAPIIHSAVCIRNGWDNIEKPGFGKGYKVIVDEMRMLQILLDRIRRRGIQIVATAHAKMRNVANPSGPDYSAWEPALSPDEAAFWRQYADTFAFVCFEDTFVRDDKTQRRAKGTSEGLRIMHTVHQPSWQAKNRWRIPDGCALDWATYEAARTECVRFEAELAKMDPAARAQWQKYVDQDPRLVADALKQLAGGGG